MMTGLFPPDAGKESRERVLRAPAPTARAGAISPSAVAWASVERARRLCPDPSLARPDGARPAERGRPERLPDRVRLRPGGAGSTIRGRPTFGLGPVLPAAAQRNPTARPTLARDRTGGSSIRHPVLRRIQGHEPPTSPAHPE